MSARLTSNDLVVHDGESMSESTPTEGQPLLAVHPRVSLALEVCRAAPTLRRTLRIAAVVGLLLTAINEGDSLVRGTVSAAIAIKIVFNFLVPFVVSNLGVLAGTRRAGSQPPSVAKPPTIVP